MGYKHIILQTKLLNFLFFYQLNLNILICANLIEEIEAYAPVKLFFLLILVWKNYNYCLLLLT